MGARRRVELTIFAGVVLGLDTLVVEQAAWPTAGLDGLLTVPLGIAAWAAFLLVPLIVGRRWVAIAVVGPVLALLVMEASGMVVRLDDGTGPAFNYRTIFFLVVAAAVLLLLACARGMVDSMRADRHGCRRLISDNRRDS